MGSPWAPMRSSCRGGVSVGPYDVVKAAIEAIGRIDLWRVAVQPGKPFAFGTAARPRGGAPVLLFGLPGNPVSSAVTFELFVRPAIRALAGRHDLLRLVDRKVVLGEQVSKSHGRRAFIRVVAEIDDLGAPARDERGRVRVHLAVGQGSYVHSSVRRRGMGSRSSPRPTTPSPAGAEVRVVGGSTAHDEGRRLTPDLSRDPGGPMDRPQPRAERRRLSHMDRAGWPRMVDVSDKPVTARRAVAEAAVAVSPETMSLIIDGGGTKGDVLGVAELAGVMGGKRTSELIPLCHPLALTDLVVAITPGSCRGRPSYPRRSGHDGPDRRRDGGHDRGVGRGAYGLRHGQGRRARRRRSSAVRLLEKTGGKSGTWIRQAPADAPPHRPAAPRCTRSGPVGSKRKGSG